MLAKAHGEIEIIVVLDGMWQEIVNDPRVKVIHHGEVHNNFGMRESINLGVRLSSGEYILKADGHTMWDEGFDLKLAADCENDWVVIPRRERLDVENWKLIEDGRKPVDYMYVEYPYAKIGDTTQGLHGAEWKQRYYDRLDTLIDDTPTMQGSAYFMARKHWDNCIGEMDSTYYGPFTHESQEISQKTWFTGGRVVVNKKTWYAHLHKGKKYGTNYGFTTEQWKKWAVLKEKGRLYCIDYWLNTKDFKYDWDWFMKKFPDMPGWGDDWKERLPRDAKADAEARKYENDNWLKEMKEEKDGKSK
jgi:glycosyltransferase involved in cell wall biosynthesis